MVEEEEEMVPQRKAEEDQVIEREAPQQEELAVTTESPEEEEPVEGTEAGGEEQDQEKEEDQCTSSECPAAGRKQQHCQHLPLILLSSGEVVKFWLILRLHPQCSIHVLALLQQFSVHINMTIFISLFRSIVQTQRLLNIKTYSPIHICQ